MISSKAFVTLDENIYVSKYILWFSEPDVNNVQIENVQEEVLPASNQPAEVQQIVRLDFCLPGWCGPRPPVCAGEAQPLPQEVLQQPVHPGGGRLEPAHSEGVASYTKGWHNYTFYSFKNLG